MGFNEKFNEEYEKIMPTIYNILKIIGGPLFFILIILILLAMVFAFITVPTYLIGVSIVFVLGFIIELLRNGFERMRFRKVLAESLLSWAWIPYILFNELMN